MKNKIHIAFGFFFVLLSMTVLMVAAQSSLYTIPQNYSSGETTEASPNENSTENTNFPKMERVRTLNDEIEEILNSEDYSPAELELLDAYLAYHPRNRHYILPCDVIDKEELLITKRFNNLARTFGHMERCQYKTGGMREIDRSFRYNDYMYRY